MKGLLDKHRVAQKPNQKNIMVKPVAHSDKPVADVVKKEKNEGNMETTMEKIAAFNRIEGNDTIQAKAKKVKMDKGLIEKVESTKTVLTEDNRELLRD